MPGGIGVEPREKKPIKVTLKDGSVKEGIAGETTPLSIAEGISKGLANVTVAAKVNGNVVDAWVPLEDDCTLELLKFDDEAGKHVYWHSSAHVLGQAMELELGGKLCIGPALEEGFYYDMGGDVYVPPRERVSRVSE